MRTIISHGGHVKLKALTKRALSSCMLFHSSETGSCFRVGIPSNKDSFFSIGLLRLELASLLSVRLHVLQKVMPSRIRNPVDQARWSKCSPMAPNWCSVGKELPATAGERLGLDKRPEMQPNRANSSMQLLNVQRHALFA